MTTDHAVLETEFAQLEPEVVQKVVQPDNSIKNQEYTHLTPGQVAQLTGWSKRKVYYFFRAHNEHVITDKGKGGAGGLKTRISIAALPVEFQKAWLALLGRAQRYEQDEDEDLFERSKLDKTIVEVLEARELAIREWQEIIGRCKGNFPGGKTRAMKTHCESKDYSDATLRRWIKSEKKRGWRGLVPEWGKTKGVMRALDDEDRLHIEAVYLNDEGRSATEIATVYESYGLFCIERGKRPASESTVRNYLNSNEIRMKKEALLAGLGDYINKKRGYSVLRDWACFDPGEIYVGDHRKQDIWIVWSDNKIIRPHVTAEMDVRAKSIVGKNVCKIPNSDSIRLALSRAFRDYGVCKERIRDNGKDYSANFFRKLLTVLKVEEHPAIPFNARAKIVENFFIFLSRRFDKSLPGYCGKDTAHKPADIDAMKKKTQERLDARLPVGLEHGTLMTRAEFEKMLDEWIAWYHQRPSKSKDMNGLSPNQVWERNSHVSLRRVSPMACGFMMMKTDSVTVRPGGVVWLNVEGLKFRYEADLLMLRFQGQEVNVRYHPDDLRTVQITNVQTDEYICTAMIDPETPGIHRDEKLKEAVIRELGRKNKVLRAEIRKGEKARRQYRKNLSQPMLQGRPDPSTLPPGPDLSQHPIEIVRTGFEQAAREADAQRLKLAANADAGAADDPDDDVLNAFYQAGKQAKKPIDDDQEITWSDLYRANKPTEEDD